MQIGEFVAVCDELDSKILPQIKVEIDQATKRLEELNSQEKKLKKFRRWHTYLRNGETMGGMFGFCPNFAYFVRSYTTQKKPMGRQEFDEIATVELLIVRECLRAHDLRVDVPDEKNPDRIVNTSKEVDVNTIVQRMLAHAKQASNVKVGTLDEVLKESCPCCGTPSLIVALDDHLDDDDGYLFRVACFCQSCVRVKQIATFADYKNGQFGTTQAIYRS